MKILVSLSKEKTYLLITGPLYSGKSTIKTALCKKFGIKPSIEMMAGLDVKEKDCWSKLIAYAKKNYTSIVEAHIAYDGKDHIDFNAKLGKITKVPANIKILTVLPPVKVLLAQQKTVDKYSTLDGAKEELEWYSKFAKLTAANKYENTSIP